MENLNLKKACPSHFPCLTLKTLYCRDLATCKWIGVYACAGGGERGVGVVVYEWYILHFLTLNCCNGTNI